MLIGFCQPDHRLGSPVKGEFLKNDLRQTGFGACLEGPAHCGFGSYKKAS